MGRRELELDPDAGPLAEFAHELRELRRRAGNPSYRELGRRTHYSASALSSAANGRSLPSRGVLAAFVRGCGGDEQSWELRRRDLAALLTTPDAGVAAPSPGGSHPRPTVAESQPEERAQQADESPAHPQSPVATATATATAVRRKRRLPAIGATAFRVLIIAMALMLTAGSESRSPISTTLGADPAIEPGHACAPTGVLAPPAPAPVPGPQRVRFSFTQPADLRFWRAWWHDQLLTRDISDDQTYQGARVLRMQVSPGYTAVGTLHIDGLRQGGTVTVALWYGGQGEAIACPFVQDKAGTIRWLPVRALQLTAHAEPGWRSFRWVIPNIPIIGTGFQINNTGATKVAVYLGTISW